jgi:predicted regulator of Ras-like GTPase activity (Roadblock/LC7/MglB family)
MVITPDGIMVAAALGADVEEESVAAFTSSLLISLNKALAKLKARGSLTSCSLTGTAGSVSFFDMDNSYLVVVAEADTKIRAGFDAIHSAIHKIKNRRVA